MKTTIHDILVLFAIVLFVGLISDSSATKVHTDSFDTQWVARLDSGHTANTQAPADTIFTEKAKASDIVLSKTTEVLDSEISPWINTTPPQESK